MDGSMVPGIPVPESGSNSVAGPPESAASASLLVGDDAFLRDAEYVREGGDLLLVDGSGRTVDVPGYFHDGSRPDLVSDGGNRMAPEMVDALARVPGGQQVAQAGPGAASGVRETEADGLVQVAQSASGGGAPIGEVTSTLGTVTVRRAAGGQSELEPGDAIFQNDVVETGSGGAVVIAFADETNFSLGANANMAIDEFVYDPASGAGALGITMAKGLFRFVSGAVAKAGEDAMTVKTPVATIGIRGTHVVGQAAPDGEANAVTLLRTPGGGIGAISVSNGGGSQTITAPNGTTRLTSFQAAPSSTSALSSAELGALYAGAGLGMLLAADGFRITEPQDGTAEPPPVPESEPPPPESRADTRRASQRRNPNLKQVTEETTSGEDLSGGAVAGEDEEEGEEEAEETGSEERLVEDRRPDDDDDRLIDVIASRLNQTEQDGPTDGPDVLYGTNGRDRIDGLGGNDVIFGFGGEDTLLGGGGDDVLHGGDDNDYLRGGAGNDTLIGGDGGDTMVGGAGGDIASYADSEDGVSVDLEGDQISATELALLFELGHGDDGEGDGHHEPTSGFAGPEGGTADGDVLVSFEGVVGSAHDDTLTAGLGGSTLIGGDGSDDLYGRGGNDYLFGGDGDDLLVGDDEEAENGDGDTLIGGAGNDTLYADDGDNRGLGGDGNDTVEFGQGRHWIDGGDGNDSISAGFGTSTLFGGDGDDEIDAGDSVSTIAGGDANEALALGHEIYGEGGDDAIATGDGDDTVAGGAGNDTVDLGAGDDLLTFGAVEGGGHDTVTDGGGDDRLEIDGITSFNLIAYRDEIGHDGEGDPDESDLLIATAVGTVAVAGQFDGGDGIETLNLVSENLGDGLALTVVDGFTGGANGDLLVASAAGSVLDGLGGDDLLMGADATDILDAGSGNDLLRGRGGDDELDGGAGNDAFVHAAGDGDDRLRDSGGDDAIVIESNQVDLAGFARAGGDYDGEVYVPGDDLLITLADGSELLVEAHFDGGRIEALSETATGTVFNLSDGQGGTVGNDVLIAGADPATISGLSGIDVLVGGAEDDLLSGGLGDDVLQGGDGDDFLDGGRGNDLLDGGYGANILRVELAHAGDTDRIEGWGGGSNRLELLASGTVEDFDSLYAATTVTDDGTDVTVRIDNGNGVYTMVFAGVGDGTVNDLAGLGLDEETIDLIRLEITNGSDAISATPSNDSIDALGGNDTINGNGGNDTLSGNSGSDRVFGDDGDDVLLGSSGADRFDGGDGQDSLDYRHAGSGVMVDLDAGQGLFGIASGDLIFDVEVLIGSNHDDVLRGGTLGEVTLLGGAGDDTLSSDADGTALFGGHGDDDITLSGIGTARGGDGDDSLSAGEGGGSLYGDGGNDTLIGSETGSMLLSGGDGDDSVLGGGADDEIELGSGDNSASGGAGSDTIQAGHGDNLLFGGTAATLGATGEEDGDDDITSGDGDDRIYAGGGNDNVQAGGGANTVFGGNGDDLLFAGHAGSRLHGGDGDDRLEAGDGDDTFAGGSGVDSLYMGGGDDLILFDAGGAGDEEGVGDGIDRVFDGGGMDRIDVAGARAYEVSGERFDLDDDETTDDLVIGSLDDTAIAIDGQFSGTGVEQITIVDDDVTWTILNGATGTAADEFLIAEAGGGSLDGLGGNDLLSGSLGNDHLDGGDGDDILNSADGNDTLLGGAGDDIYSRHNETGHDLLSDSDGDDTIMLLDGQIDVDGFARGADPDDLVITLLDGDTLTIQDHFAGQRIETLFGEEDEVVLSLASGSQGTLEDDVLVAAAGGATLSGQGGDDILVGNGGDDFLTGGAGDDRISGGGGSDTVQVNLANVGEVDVITDWEAGSDRLEIVGAGAVGDFNSLLAASAVTDDGTDVTLEIDIGDGIVTLVFEGAGDGTVTNLSDIGVDTGTVDVFQLDATQGDDIVSGTPAGDTIDGLGGNDTISGNGGNDLLTGGAGDDLVHGNDGDDRLFGSDGADMFDGGTGSDTVDYGDAAFGISVDFDAGGGLEGQAAGDTYSDIETLVGTDFDDVVIAGSESGLHVYGGAGDDSLSSGNGGLTLSGEGDDDTLFVQNGSWGFGGEGDDSLTGANGDNDLHGGAGQDDLISIDGGDRLFGEDGDDTLTGGAAATTLSGGGGNDSVVGGAAADRLLGGDGADILRGGDGNDTLDGDLGADRIEGGRGDDVIGNTQDADDRIVIDLGHNGDMDRMTGWQVGDSLIVAGFDGGTYTDLDALALVDDDGSDVTITFGTESDAYQLVIEGIGDGTIDSLAAIGIEADVVQIEGDYVLVTGTPGNDSLTGSAADEILEGLAGNDVLDGAGGADVLRGGAGDDSVEGNAGAESIDGGDGFDEVSYAGSFAGVQVDLGTGIGLGGAAEGDRFAGIEQIVGSQFGDRLFGGDSSVSLDGGGGTDTLIGSRGGDVLAGGEDGDWIDGGVGYDIIDGGGGRDTLLGGAGEDILYGDAGSDRIEGGFGDNIVLWAPPLDGNDTLVGGTAFDEVSIFDSGILIDSAHRDGNDLTIRFTDGSRLVMEDHYAGHQIDLLHFADDAWVVLPDGVIGSLSDDVMVADDSGQALFGHAGSDLLNGGAGDDTLDGGEFLDLMIGGAGSDVFRSDLSDDFGFTELDLIGDWEIGTDKLEFYSGQGVEDYGDLVSGSVVFEHDGDVILAIGNPGDFKSIIFLDAATGSIDSLADLGLTAGNVTIIDPDGTDGGDVLDGTAGADSLFGRAGNDTLQGLGGNDTLDAGIGFDSLSGGDGNDLLRGYSGFATFAGGDGNDTLIGGEGLTSMSGGAGADLFDGRGDFAIVDYHRALGPMVVDLGAGTASGGEAAGDMFVAVGGLVGSDFNDSLVGGDDSFLIDGWGGNDTLVGGAGGSSLYGNSGDDLLRSVGDSLSNLDGGAGNDSLVGSSGADAFVFDGVTGGGDDVISDAGGLDLLVLSNLDLDRGEVDRFGDENQHLRLTTPEGSVTFLDAYGEDGLETVLIVDDEEAEVRAYDLVDGTGTDADELLVAADSGAVLDGAGGDDLLIGAAGNDTLRGGVGDDLLDGGEGHDSLSGQAGDDVLSVLDVDPEDVLDGGDGIDVLDLSAVGDAGDTPTVMLADVAGSSLEIIDLGAGGEADAMILDVAAADIGALTGGDTLIVRGDADDAIRSDDGWLVRGAEIVDGVTYQLLESATGARLLVEPGIDLSGAIADAMMLAGNNNFVSEIGGPTGQTIGTSVAAAGDFNGDGFADVVIGAPDAGFGADTNAGGAYVLFGSATGLPTDLTALDGSNGFWIGPDLSGVTVEGGGFGTVVEGVGDINDDGFDDIAISAPHATVGADFEAGHVLLLYGTDTPVAGGVFDGANLTADDGVIFFGTGAGEQLGLGLSEALDYTQDGVDDFMISTGIGDVYLVDAADGVPGAATLTSDDLGGPINGSQDVGPSVAVANGYREDSPSPVLFFGDTTHDGFVDGFPPTQGTDTGAVLGANPLLGAGTTTMLTGGASHDEIGSKIISGSNVSGGFLDEILIAGENSTSVYLVEGGLYLYTSLRLQPLSSGRIVELELSAPGMGSGPALAMGDIGGDNYSDVLVGEAHGDGAASDSGVVHVVAGGDLLPSQLTLGADNDLTFLGENAGDQAGDAVAWVGDVDGDGFGDFLVGAPGRDSGAGSVFLVKGGGNGSDFIGSANADVMEAQPVFDAVLGRAGDDRIVMADATDRVAIDGGSGIDTLVFSGDAVLIDVGFLDARGVDAIDLGSLGANDGRILIVTPQGVVALSDDGVLRVAGDEYDRVDLSGWVASGGTIEEGGVTYDVYTDDVSSTAAELWVERGVTADEQAGNPVVYTVQDFLTAPPSGFSADPIAGTHEFGSLAGLKPVGDINGDGHEDYLIDEGVAYGDGSGIPNIADSSEYDGTNGFAITNQGGNARYASLGDINGDGFDDLSVSRDDDSQDNLGDRAWVILGGDDLGATIAVDSNPNVVEVVNSTAYGAGTSRPDAGKLGEVVNGIGDINGDGIDDFLVVASIGGPGYVALQEPGGQQPGPGEAYVIFGDTGGFPASFDVNSLDGSNGFVFNGEVGARTLGYLTAHGIGDFNGDGFDDFILDQSMTDPNCIPGGSLYVVYGGDNFGGTAIAPADLDGTRGFRLDAGAAKQNPDFGTGLGDVNGDGFSDFAFSIDDGANSGLIGARTTFVLFGGTEAYPATLDLNSLAASLDGANGFVIEGHRPGAGFGRIQSAGDVNGDGLDDMIVYGSGNPGGTEVSGSFNGGYSGLLFGSADGFAPVVTADDFNGDNGFYIHPDQDGLTSRAEIDMAGDVDGDGFDDLLINQARNTEIESDGPNALLYGGDYLAQLDAIVGDGADNLLAGTGGDDVIVGGLGNDTLVGGGGVDALQGGSGDDRFSVGDDGFRKIDGGNCNDMLLVDGFDLDLTGVSNLRVESVEAISLEDGSINGLSLDISDVLDLNADREVRIFGDAGDAVTATGGAWQDQGTETDGDTTFDLYVDTDTGARLLVDQDITNQSVV